MRLPNREEILANLMTYDEALRNFARYQPDVQDALRKTISMGHGFIFMTSGGKSRAAPLKFCGAGAKMTPEKYLANRDELGGTTASNRVGEIFFPDGDWINLERTTDHVKQFRRLVRSVGADFKSNACFYGLPGENIDDTERAKVEKLVSLFKAESLGKNARTAFIARLSA